MLRPKPEATPRKGTPIKYRIVKAIDVAGLNFLTPVVRLCFREEPQKQLKQIGQFIVIPAVGVILAIFAWDLFADKVVTKSGKLPDPTETYHAASTNWTFHHRENEKLKSFSLEGDRREKKLASVEKRLEELVDIEKTVNEKVARVEAEAAERSKLGVADLETAYAKLKSGNAKSKTQRETELKETAESLQGADRDARDAYVISVRTHRDRLEAEKLELRELKSELDLAKNKKDPEIAAVQREQTLIAEERQFLGKLKDQLTSANRSIKIGAAEEKLLKLKEDFYAADAGALFASANKIVQSESRIEKLAESSYSPSKTLPYQVQRSVLCVFTGFLLGASIAIPIGVMCGLSKTFMAAVTPFIATFKPVSPIVWLPICMILCAWLIPDADKHWFPEFFSSLPLIGRFEIGRPAFIASASTVALCSLWATLTNTALGVASVDKDHMNVARVLRLGFKDRLFKIVLPSALPLVFAGLRISLGIGWMVLIAAELLSSSEGIGKYVWDQYSNGSSQSFANMVFVVFVVGAIGLILDRMMVVLQRLVSFDGAPTAI